jgi:hypothetical protein
MRRTKMYPSETLTRDRCQETLDRAHEARRARQATELRKIRRIQQRAERRLLDARRRAEEIRAALDVTP